MNVYFVHIIKGDKPIRLKPDRAKSMEAANIYTEVEAWTKKLEQWITNKEMPRARLLVACRGMFRNNGPGLGHKGSQRH